MSTILVIGASRGIGLEFVRQYRAEGERVIATGRDDAALARLQALGAEPLRVDVADPASIGSLAAQLGGKKVDIALYVAGVMDRAGASTPPTQPVFDHIMRTNVLGAMLLIPQVAPLVEAAGGRFAFVSSAMAQIGGVESSYGWLYRASKAALNMAMASARHDYPRCTMVALSPGWVKTDMGGPGAPLSVEDSVAMMRSTLARLQLADSGSYLQPDGRRFDSW